MADRAEDASFSSPTAFFQVDEVCDQFDAAWRDGQRPEIEPYLARFAEPLRSRAMRELLLIEIEYREAAGERPTLKQYIDRFPNDAQSVKQVFQRLDPITTESGSPSTSALTVILEVTDGPHQGKRFEFSNHDSFIVGRGKAAHFRLPKQDPYFSRLHFLVEVNPPECRLVDLVSRNGTRVNGRRLGVDEAVDLKSGDIIRAGHTTFQVHILGWQALDAPPGTKSGTAGDHLAHRRAAKRPDPSQTDVRANPNEPEPSVAPTEEFVDSPPALPSGADRKRRPPRAVRSVEPPEVPQIPGYECQKELGRGGMGVVYLARRVEDGARFAMKTIRPVRGTSTREIQRFLRECQILKSLEHPAIVAFHEFGHTGTLLFLVMDYVPGSDARRILRRDGPLPTARAVNILCQALEGLDHAHQEKFVHRDIKPANLLVSEAGPREICRVADFGLGRMYQASRISGLTLLGDVGGTLPFMAPEQILDYRHAQPTADIYSAAVTLYHLLTGRFVYDFENDEVPNRIKKILSQPPIPIRHRRPDIPSGLADIIHQALNRDPQRRFGSAAEFRETLLQWTGGPNE